MLKIGQMDKYFNHFTLKKKKNNTNGKIKKKKYCSANLIEKRIFYCVISMTVFIDQHLNVN